MSSFMTFVWIFVASSLIYFLLRWLVKWFLSIKVTMGQFIVLMLFIGQWIGISIVIIIISFL